MENEKTVEEKITEKELKAFAKGVALGMMLMVLMQMISIHLHLS